MFPELINDLKKLQYQRCDSSPFASHLAFLQWGDSVSPRLSFDQKLQNTFKSHIRMATIQHSSGYSNIEQINEAIGILNQAVLLLETKPLDTSPLPLIELPQKLTLMWLYQHAPWPFYAWSLGALGFAFTLGLNFSNVITTIQSKNFNAAAPQTTTDTNASENAKSTDNASITKPHIAPLDKK